MRSFIYSCFLSNSQIQLNGRPGRYQSNVSMSNTCQRHFYKGFQHQAHPTPQAPLQHDPGVTYAHEVLIFGPVLVLPGAIRSQFIPVMLPKHQVAGQTGVNGHALVTSQKPYITEGTRTISDLTLVANLNQPLQTK